MPALSFQINLTGSFAAQLKPANEGLKQTEGSAKKAAHGLEVFEVEAGKLSGSLGGLGVNLAALGKGGQLFTFDLAEGLKAVFEIGKKVIETIADLGKEIFKTAANAQDLDLAIELNVGKGQAEAINRLADSFSNTRFSPSQMKSALLPLLKQGIGDTATLDTIATIATDLAARTGGGIADVQQSIGAFANIFQRGRIKPQMLAQFGIQAQDYFAQLGSSLGVSADAAAKMAKQGKINQDKLADVAINMIAARQGGVIGDATNRAGANLNTMFARLAALPERYFEKLANSPALGTLSNALERALAALDPNSPTGARIMASLDRLIGKIANIVDKLSTPEGMDGLAKGIDQAISAAGTLVEVFKEVLSVVGKLLSVGDQLGKMGDDIAMALGGPGAVIERAKARQAQLLSQIQAQGQAQQFVGMMNAAASGLGGGSALATIPGIPHMASGGIVDSPTVALIGESGPEAVVPLGRGGGGRGPMNVNVDLTVQVQGGGADATKQGTEAGQAARIELMKIMRETSAMFGVEEG